MTPTAVVVLVALAVAAAGAGADDGAAVPPETARSASGDEGQRQHRPVEAATLEVPEAAPTGEVTDAERAMFASRSPACAACQRVVLHLDETLLPRAFDEKAKAAGRKTASDPSRYGRYEAMVEEEVSRACQASAIQLAGPIRRACHAMLEAREEHLVAAWYARVTQEEDWNMNRRLCGAPPSDESGTPSRGGARAREPAPCPDGIARLDVPALDRLEQEAKLAAMRQPVADRTVGTLPKYQSQPARVGAQPAGPGVVETFVGQDFYRRAIAADDVDVLVYFAQPTARPHLHAAAMHTMRAAAAALADQTKNENENKNKKNKKRRRRGGSGSSSVVLATLNAELNEVPHPYGSHIQGPTFIMYVAGEKHKPRLLPLRGSGGGGGGGGGGPGGDDDDPEDAPTLGDVLVLFQRRGGSGATREAAGAAVMAADQRLLEGEGRTGGEKEDL